MSAVQRTPDEKAIDILKNLPMFVYIPLYESELLQHIPPEEVKAFREKWQTKNCCVCGGSQIGMSLDLSKKFLPFASLCDAHYYDHKSNIDAHKKCEEDYNKLMDYTVDFRHKDYASKLLCYIKDNREAIETALYSLDPALIPKIST